MARRDNFPDRDIFFPSLAMTGMSQLLIVSFELLSYPLLGFAAVRTESIAKLGCASRFFS
jgi:hypothetical protein